MSVIRRWNLNEGLGRCAKTNILESNIELHLGLKRPDGTRHDIGRFRLDLTDLSRKGFVARRVVEGNRAFDVQIYLRRRDHPLDVSSYYLGVNDDRTTPLAPYSM